MDSLVDRKQIFANQKNIPKPFLSYIFFVLDVNGSRYTRMDQVKFVEESL